MDAYLQSSACIDPHLADQLLLPMALAGGGRFTTPVLSEHLRTNAAMIEKFLPVGFEYEACSPDGWQVLVHR